MSYLVPDTTEEQTEKLEANGWSYVADSWGRSVYWHEDHGQKWAVEALELVDDEA